MIFFTSYCGCIVIAFPVVNRMADANGIDAENDAFSEFGIFVRINRISSACCCTTYDTWCVCCIQRWSTTSTNVVVQDFTCLAMDSSVCQLCMANKPNKKAPMVACDTFQSMSSSSFQTTVQLKVKKKKPSLNSLVFINLFNIIVVFLIIVNINTSFAINDDKTTNDGIINTLNRSTVMAIIQNATAYGRQWTTTLIFSVFLTCDPICKSVALSNNHCCWLSVTFCGCGALVATGFFGVWRAKWSQRAPNVPSTSSVTSANDTSATWISNESRKMFSAAQTGIKSNSVWHTYLREKTTSVNKTALYYIKVSKSWM